jgi:hypothetical protein
MIRVRLTRKLAPKMNGIDVSRLQEGDVTELPDDRAMTLIELGWAERATDLDSSTPQPLRNPLNQKS